jgi:hypothetical protein
MMLVLGNNEGNEHVDIEQTDHRLYWPSARRFDGHAKLCGVDRVVTNVVTPSRELRKSFEKQYF